MAKPAARLGFLKAVLTLGVLVILIRAFTVQVSQHDLWQERAERRNVRARDVIPKRGSILDRQGVPLASTFEAYHLSVAQNELVNVGAVKELLGSSLGLGDAEIERRFRSPYPWFAGPFDAAQVLPLRSVRGITLERVVEREGRLGNRARPMVGLTVAASGKGSQGIEASHDSLLRGVLGKERYLLDGGGRAVVIPGGMLLQSRPGHDLFLTIDHELQGIVESALADAVAAFSASGGDVVVLDVRSGELIALASLRTPREGGVPVPGSAAIVEPYEPGSTAKIFTAAALLEYGIDTSAVPGYDGEWRMEVAEGRFRTIRDEHREPGMFTLGETLKYSSNIAISQFAMRLSGEQQFRMLRSFGFGTPPGTGFPGESPGLLVPPGYKANLLYTIPSWAQGYEMLTSSLQLAMAYAAIANGGILIEPTLVREVRDGRTGELVWRHQPDTVRRVVSSDVARRLMDYLALVTDSGGTGTGAQLDFNGVIGKTGTAKLDGGSSGYLEEYRGSFAAIFPEDDPQFVVFVMIDRPTGEEYYGGDVAAPVVKSILQQSMALPVSPLESGRLSSVVGLAPLPPKRPEKPRLDLVRHPVPLAVVRSDTTVAVPIVTHLRLREAIHLVTSRGLRARLRGRGTVTRTSPAAGELITAGGIVTIHASPDTAQ